MKHAVKAILATSALFAAPLGTAPAFAQATTTIDNEQTTTAQKAERLKNQSIRTHNPTERNGTFKNQMNEQPDPKTPTVPMGRTVPTGRTSSQMPISSPQHEKASQSMESMPGMDMGGMDMSGKPAKK